MITTCEQCGAAPAQLVKSRRHIGLVVYGRTINQQAVLCRTHGRSLILSDLTKTALLGWWGVYSFLINLLVIPAQLSELSKVGKLGSSEAATRYESGKGVLAGSEVI
jgi:hypothetical protein